MRRDAEKPSPFNRKLKRSVKERDGERCVTCGSESGLTVHHVDGNRFNNHPDNLVTLCTVCHKKIHTPVIYKKRRRKAIQTVQYEDEIYLRVESPHYITILLNSGEEKH